VHDGTGDGVEAQLDLAQHDQSVPIDLSPSLAADDRTYSGDQERTTRECPRFDAGTSRRTFWAEAGWNGATVAYRRLVPKVCARPASFLEGHSPGILGESRPNERCPADARRLGNAQGHAEVQTPPEMAALTALRYAIACSRSGGSDLAY
jgi:hypothetical protein